MYNVNYSQLLNSRYILFRNLFIMCLSKYSNLDLLGQVICSNLYSSEEQRNLSGFCEIKLAALINSFYQVFISKNHKAFLLSVMQIYSYTYV